MSLDVASAAFLEGYRIGALHDGRHDALTEALAALTPEKRPFAWEGAGMAWTVGDARAPRREAARELVVRVDACWRPFVALGIGCALARLRRDCPDDPIVQDGYGFQLGLSDALRAGPETAPSAVRRGRGRALWFRTGGDADACASLLALTREPGPAWEGIGTACVFAGDPKGHASRLREVATERARDLLRGAARAHELWGSFGGAVPDRVKRAWGSLARGAAEGGHPEAV